ncbi:MAG: PASTA domain-containing protein [Salinivirgaceae bacterium]|nr:PASTA domain-containing protein [Salinivirgaceae bacterium]
MRWQRIFKKQIFWRTLLYSFGLYVVLFLLVAFGLKMYTHHGRSFPVPDFKGLERERVFELAKDNHLNLQIIDSTYLPYLTKGSVIEQSPQHGVHVKRNRTIFLTVNAFNQAKVEMPNVVGVSFRQGKTTLESRGLKVGRLIYAPDFAKNNILKQMIGGTSVNPGAMIEKDQRIDLVLGNGYGQSTSSIPNLFDLNYSRASNEIIDAYFNVGRVSYDSSVKTYSDSIGAKVWKQYPAYFEGGRAVMGSRVDIWLSMDPAQYVK